jgi:catechol 2,3-dioxygenase-like lactoylglutathione lyase family enzyme
MASADTPPVPIFLDHIAVAADIAWDNFDRYRGDLGGEWNGGMHNPGFYWGQVRYANGMIVEMLQPHDVHLDDFLRRFIDRSGDGPHHLTFKVPDIGAAIDAATAAGFPPVRSNLTDDFWKEAFLHPKQCHGIVVQLAQAAHHEWDDEVQHHVLPPSRSPRPATLDRIVHLVADLDAALTLFRDVLGGSPTAGTNSNPNPNGPSVELTWPGAGRLQLVEPTSAEFGAWLGDRPGRVHCIEFTMAGAAAVRGARLIGEGVFEIDPAMNHGVRLHLREAQ